MNEKGFTLIELLATIVIISLILGIATTGVLNAIENSKKNSEKVFVKKLETALESYIDLNGSKISKSTTNTTTYQFEKCRRTDDNGNCVYNSTDPAEIKEEQNFVDVYELESFNLSTITTSAGATISKDQIVNPANKKKCLDDGDPKVRIFKDTDYVYYYYVDLSYINQNGAKNTLCGLSDSNAIITNIPDKLCQAIGGLTCEG